MTKYFGNIGFAEVESKEGIWNETITDRPYYGDILRNNRRLKTTDQVNDDIHVANQISIVSDPYANQNFHAIRCAEFMGTRWKVTDVEIQYPRLILTLGGVYNGQPPKSSGSL